MFVFLIFPDTLFAQHDNDNKNIEKHRKGKLFIYAKPGDQVRIEQQNHEFWFGASICDSFVGNMAEGDKLQYEQKFLENFNSAVTANALKWHGMERVKGQVDYGLADDILAWADRHGIPLRGHNVYWGVDMFVQDWLRELDDESLAQTIKNRAEDVASRYKGRFAEYDLNNEMIHGNFYEDRLGSDITKKMVDWFHAVDSDAQLYLNDYDITTGVRLDDYMAHIRKLVSQGVRIAGIGVQGHLHAESFDRNELRRSLDSLSIFELPVRITEFNVPGQRSKYYRENITEMPKEEEVFTAKELEDFYRICFAHPAVDGMLMWGFWAAENWIPVSSMYRKDWTLSPLGEAYRNLVFGEWWTTETDTVGDNGVVAMSGFYGKYKVTVNGEVREVDLSKNTREVRVDFLRPD